MKLVGFLCPIVLAACTATTWADTVTIGAPGNAFDGDCAPFGCAVEYQQVYGHGAFSGPVSISGITFFNNNFVPGSIASANYTISFSTTNAVVNGLAPTFADNLGADNQVFFSGPLGGPIGPSNDFTLTGTPFTYDPAAGNLLLTVTSDGVGLDFSVFLDYESNAPAGTFSRAYSFDTLGVASELDSDTGLVTEFIFTPSKGSTSSVPEVTSFWLLAIALPGLAICRLSCRPT